MASHPIIQYASSSSWALIEDKISPFAKENLTKLINFLEDEVYPAARVVHAQIPADPENLFLSKAHYLQFGVPLTNLEYGTMAELLGHGGVFASEVVNCSAPDTGNMETLARYASPEQQQKCLLPLLNGQIRSAFSTTEWFVAPSDATNVQMSIRQEGNEIVINGHKLW
ncbi:hypothetical protein V8D89_012770 [Ganoderma adspersum]